MPSLTGALRGVLTWTLRRELSLPAPLLRAGHDFRPVFLIGCARSGTTLVSGALAAHPQIVGWSEANDVWDPEWFTPGADPDRPLPAELDPSGFYSVWRDRNRDRLTQIAAVFSAYQKLLGGRVFLNKSPSNTLRIPEIDAVFPDARYIHLVRDGRAVVQSYRSHIVSKGKLEEWPREVRDATDSDPASFLVTLAEFWQHNLRTVAEVDQRLMLTSSGRLLTIRYEDFLDDAGRAMQALTGFIGVDPSLLPVPDVRPPAERWRSWDPETLARVSAALEPSLADWGYR